jgi:hypothetical protein
MYSRYPWPQAVRGRVYSYQPTASLGRRRDSGSPSSPQQHPHHVGRQHQERQQRVGPAGAAVAIPTKKVDGQAKRQHPAGGQNRQGVAVLMLQGTRMDDGAVWALGGPRHRR